MPRFAATLFLLFCTTTLTAQTADLEIQVTSTQSRVRTGEPFTVTLHARNNGPDTAASARVGLSFDRTPFVLAVTAPRRWTCVLSMDVSCFAWLLPAGSIDEIVVTVLAPTTESVPMQAFIIPQGTRDPSFSNTRAPLPVALERAAVETDISIDWLPRASPAAPGSRALIDAFVRNNGAETAPGVYAWITAPNGSAIAGTGWSCAERQGGWMCHRGELAPNQAAPLTVTTPIGRDEERMSVFGWVQGVSLLDNGRLNNNLASASFTFGDAENYEPILVPLTAWKHRPTSGAFGSQWVTELTLFVQEEVRIYPRQINCAIGGCIPPPLARRPHDPVGDIVPIPDGRAPGTLLYTRRGEAEKLQFTLRVRDVSEPDASWGTQIPVVRERDFRTSGFVLNDVPVTGAFRSMLRVYDPDRRTNPQFIVRYFDPNGALIGEVRRRFDSPAEVSIPPALLPLFAAYSQIDVGRDLILTGIDRISIEVEPAEPGQRIWGFVSVTSNVTQQVTVIAPN